VALRQISFGDDEGEWVLLEELDSLLADSPAVATRLRRITYRRRAAWLAYGSGSGKLNEVGQLINEVLTQAVALRREPTLVLSPEQEEDLTHSELDMAWLRAELFLSKDDRPTALQEFRSALDRLVSVDPIGTRSELRRLRAEFNARLATLVEDRNTAARHAVEAAVWSTGNTVVAFRFDRLALVVLASDQDALVLQFCEIAFGVGSDRAGRHLIANFYGRQGRRAVEFLDVATLLVTRLTGMRRGADVFSQIASTALQVVRSLVRRIQTVGEKTSSRVVATVHELVSALRGASISDDLLAELTAMAAALESTSNVSTRRRVLRAD
jgi:hypothetical protein